MLEIRTDKGLYKFLCQQWHNLILGASAIVL